MKRNKEKRKKRREIAFCHRVMMLINATQIIECEEQVQSRRMLVRAN
jgi:hypothetical protein